MQNGVVADAYDRNDVVANISTDAHTTEDLSAFGAPPPDKVIAHTNLYWRYHSAPGPTAATVDTDDVDFTG